MGGFDGPDDVFIFHATLENLGVSVGDARPHGDHHAYEPADFDGVLGTVIMTEKDAVKCEALRGAVARSLADADLTLLRTDRSALKASLAQRLKADHDRVTPVMVPPVPTPATR